MSDSRLEKFIYAICSMDVSDLPVPLSRIEKLWNCLITGETPDFEPLSRNEKYLMAMLDRYDISNLPAPMSRGEKLLYKIAVGETDLSDVPDYLSRYEELLKYLIENGEISEDDFEYVLYTLNRSLSTLYLTAEKPVKCAILKGQTVSNLWKELSNEISVQGQQEGTTIQSDYSEQYGKVTFGEKQVNTATTVGMYTTQQLQGNKTYYINTFILDGSETTDRFLIRDSFNNVNLQTTVIEEYPIGQILSFTTEAPTNKLLFYYYAHSRKYGEVNYGEPYYMPKRFIVSDKLEDVVNRDFFEGMQSVKMPVLTTSNEDGTKSNILTVNEDVMLRGIGDMQDKLDCLTGEVTESIGEIVLDGTQYMEADGRGIYIQVDDMKKVEDYRTIITCDKLPVFYQQWDLPNVENGISGYRDEENKYPGQNWLYIKVNNSIDVDEVRQMLIQNPITVQYALVEESIKTVDLTVVDQDNQPTELGTFENVTHVSLEAENLIPEVEMEVATRISTELASASPLMDDISTKQEQLNTTVDEQSENVDATMIATTEIFEEIL